MEGWRGEPGIFLSKRLYLHIGATACECSYLQLGPKAALTKAQFGQLPNYNYLLRNNDKMLSVFERKMRQDPSVYISTGLTKYMIVCTKTYIKHIHMFSTKLIAAPYVMNNDEIHSSMENIVCICTSSPNDQCI